MRLTLEYLDMRYGGIRGYLDTTPLASSAVSALRDRLVSEERLIGELLKRSMEAGTACRFDFEITQAAAAQDIFANVQPGPYKRWLERNVHAHRVETLLL